LPDIKKEYVGEPARYFHGVARNIILEAWRRKEIATDKVPERFSKVTDTTDRYDCLLKCLKLLSDDKCDLILDYYLYKGRDKIKQHRHMAVELGITEGALRLRAHYIRVTLEKCVTDCIKNHVDKQKPSVQSLLKRGRMTSVINKEHQS
jgi:DNA-directed RNA polymerase specialized sigma24 family protein